MPLTSLTGLVIAAADGAWLLLRAASDAGKAWMVPGAVSASSRFVRGGVMGHDGIGYTNLEFDWRGAPVAFLQF